MITDDGKMRNEDVPSLLPRVCYGTADDSIPGVIGFIPSSSVRFPPTNPRSVQFYGIPLSIHHNFPI